MKSSVNKFGHIRGVRSKMGPPGVGFHLTADGDFDLQHRLLTNIRNPVGEQDAVTKSYLKRKFDDTLTIDKKENVSDCRYTRLANVKNPEKGGDAVNVDYLREKAMMREDDDFDSRNKRIKRIGEPVEESDAVNISYIEKKLVPRVEAMNLKFMKEHAIVDGSGGEFDAKNRRIENLSYPKELHDAVNREYFEKMFAQTLHLKNLQYWNAKSREIKNLAEPVDSADAVTLKMMKGIIKVHEYFMMKELADLTIRLREDLLTMIELAEGGNYTRKAKQVKNDLNSIKEDHKRTWRWAFDSKDEAVKTVYSESERKQISNHSGVDLKIIDEYLKV